MDNIPLNTPTYATTDLHFAAFLKTAGVPFRGPEREGARTTFVFDNVNDAVKDLKRAYFARIPMKISALTYADEIRTLKNLTHM